MTNTCPEGLPTEKIRTLINAIGKERWNRSRKNKTRLSGSEEDWLEYHTQRHYEKADMTHRQTRVGSDCGWFPIADEGSQVEEQDQHGRKPTTEPKPEVSDRSMNRLAACGLWEVNTGQLSVINEPEWECLRMTVDSGASDTVVPPSFAKNCPLLPSPKVGVEYEVANGDSVYNLGEKKCTMKINKDSKTNFLMSFQVVEVHKPLLAVSKLVQAGHQVHFDQKNPHILLSTGEKLPMILSGGTYEIELWLRNPSFSGQSQR